MTESLWANPPHTSNNDLGAWMRSVRPLTVVASLAGVAGLVVVSLALAVAHGALTGRPLRLGGIEVPLVAPGGPDGGSSFAGAVAVVIVLFTVSAVIESLLRRVDGVLVRHRLNVVVAAADVTDVKPRQITTERVLLESWMRLVGTTVEAAGFTVVLALLGGGVSVAGLAMAVVVAASVGVVHWRRASEASEAYFTNQGRARLARRNRRNDPDSYREALVAVGDAVVRRDLVALRLPVVATVLLAGGVLVAVLVPVAVAGSPQELAAFLVVALLWRQRVIGAVTGLGQLAWCRAVWSSARGDDTDDANED